jgi:hypothetical protein
MLEIRKRHGPEDFETVATYQNGEFEGDEDLIEGLRSLEGMPEEEIMKSIDGPRLIAVQVEEERTDKEQEEDDSRYVIGLETEEDVDWLKEGRKDTENDDAQ